MRTARTGYLIAVFVVLALIAAALWWHRGGGELYTYSRVLMGTVVEITLKEDAPEAAEAAFNEIARLEGLLSTYRSDSEIAHINASAPKPIKVSPEVFTVVSLALRVCLMTDGAFDPTVGPLVRLWGFKGGSPRVPDRGQIESALRLVDCGSVRLDRDNHTVGLAMAGMELDCGGIAKGYIVDRAVEILKERGIGWAIVNAGGDVTFYSSNGAESFRVGIRHPDREGALLGTLVVGSGSVATSGDYERYFVSRGKRYHHILDPRTGMPARGLRSVTVVADDAYLADALATALFVMGRVQGLELVDRLDGVEALFVDSDGRVYMSKGLEGAFIKAEP